MNDRVDVIAVSFDSGEILWLEPDRTEANAKAIINLAIARQGVEDRFYVVVPAGKHKAGETYEG